MGVLWLILKIILGVILGILIILIAGICVVVFLPIDYHVYFEKYHESVIEARVRLFYLFNIHYHYEDDRNLITIKLWGIPLKKMDLSPEEMEELGEDVVEGAKHAVAAEEKIAQETTSPVAGDQSDEKVGVASTKMSVEKEKTAHTSKERSTTQKTKEADKAIKTEKKIKKSKHFDDEKIEHKSESQATWLESLRKLWVSEARKVFFSETFKLIKRFLKLLKPNHFQFRLVIGKENPADTGELIAKITMFYPLMYRYGIVDGNYTEAGLWGEVAVGGRIKLFQLLKIVIIFALNKEVRNYIKLILNVRKVEVNGV